MPNKQPLTDPLCLLHSAVGLLALVIVWIAVSTTCAAAQNSGGPCGLSPTDWCRSVPTDPCGRHPNERSCRADPRCVGLAAWPGGRGQPGPAWLRLTHGLSACVLPSSLGTSRYQIANAPCAPRVIEFRLIWQRDELCAVIRRQIEHALAPILASPFLFRASIRSLLEATKFHQMYRGPPSVAPPRIIRRAPRSPAATVICHSAGTPSCARPRTPGRRRRPSRR